MRRRFLGQAPLRNDPPHASGAAEDDGLRHSCRQARVRRHDAPRAGSPGPASPRRAPGSPGQGRRSASLTMGRGCRPSSRPHRRPRPAGPSSRRGWQRAPARPSGAECGRWRGLLASVAGQGAPAPRHPGSSICCRLPLPRLLAPRLPSSCGLPWRPAPAKRAGVAGALAARCGLRPPRGTPPVGLATACPGRRRGPLAGTRCRSGPQSGVPPGKSRRSRSAAGCAVPRRIFRRSCSDKPVPIG